MFIWLKTKYYQWKFRFIDEDVCCCGGKITGTWCGAPHPCRSAKEYAVTKAVEGNGKFINLFKRIFEHESN